MAEDINNGGDRQRQSAKNRRRRGGHSRTSADNARRAAPDAPVEAAEARENDQIQRQQRRGRRSGSGNGRANRPARIISDNVITTDADEKPTPAAIPAPVETAADRSRYRQIPDHWFDEEQDVKTESEPVETVEIVGVRFKDNGKVYYFAPMGYECREGMEVIVETARGIEFGYVTIANRQEPVTSLAAALRPVVRIATDADRERHAHNVEREAEAMRICAKKIEEHGLLMKLIEAEYTFDNSKLTFYFSADGRIDFRELVKDLASVFRTRIELRQIGIRDEAKLLGGLGICGRPFCCCTFLYDFNQVSIKMAKEQNLSLNSTKISGTCGRLMCCLRYENDVYDEEIKRTPRVDTVVRTQNGVGVVVDSQPLTGRITVRFGDGDGAEEKQFHRDEVTVMGRRRSPEKQQDEGGDSDGDGDEPIPDDAE